MNLNVKPFRINQERLARALDAMAERLRGRPRGAARHARRRYGVRGRRNSVLRVLPGL